MKAIKIFTAILLNRLNKPTKVPCKKNAKLIHWDIHVNTISIQFNKYCLNCLKIRHKYKKMVYFQPTSCTCTCSLKTKKYEHLEFLSHIYRIYNVHVYPTQFRISVYNCNINIYKIVKWIPKMICTFFIVF